MKRNNKNSCDWPELFNMRCLAQMIFKFFNRLQIQHWMDHATPSEQSTIFGWLDRSLALRLYNSYLRVANFDLIETCNLKLNAQWLIHHVETMSFEARDRLCEHLQQTNTMLEFTPRHTEMLIKNWNGPTFKSLQPLMSKNLLHFEFSSIVYFEMNREQFEWTRTVPNSGPWYTPNDFYVAIKNGRPWIARHIWNEHVPSLDVCPYIDLKRSPTFNFDYTEFDSNVESSGSAVSINFTSSDEESFIIETNYVPSRLCFDALDNLLQMQTNNVQPDAPSFEHTVNECICHFEKKSWDELCWIFERSCFIGHANIVRYIWRLAVTTNEHICLKNMLKNCAFGHNADIFEFAWEIDSEMVKNHATKWAKCAFKMRNIILWRFLQTKQLLSNEILFDPRQKVWLKLCSKPVAFLKVVWQDTADWFDNFNTMVHYALRKNNAGVLRFLAAKRQFPQFILWSHFLKLAKLNLYQIILHVTDQNTLLLKDVKDAYEHACMHSCVALFDALMCLSPLKNLETDISWEHIEDFSTDFCRVLLKYITPKQLLKLTAGRLDEPEIVELFDAIHFDIDNVDF